MSSEDYERGYEDGGSNNQADWQFALDVDGDLLPEGVEAQPTQVAEWIERVRAEVWDLFSDWETIDDMVTGEFAVGQAERQQAADQQQERRRRLVALIGEPPSTQRDEGVAEPRAETRTDG